MNVVASAALETPDLPCANAVAPSVTKDDEAELVQRVAEGDREAFRHLVERHQMSLVAYAQRTLGERSAAEDTVQEAFLRLWTRAGDFRPEKARLTTWLHNITHNLCVDAFRRGARLDYRDTAEDELGSSPGATDVSIHDQEHARLRAAIGDLPERQRSALLLCHYQGFSNRDAAQVLDVSVDALESLLARARRTLKKELGIHGT